MVKLVCAERDGISAEPVRPVKALFVQAFVQQPESVSMPHQQFDFVTGTVTEDENALIARVQAHLQLDNGT